MKDFIYKKLIKYFVLLSPIIDMITSYMYYNDYSLTLGLVIKILVLLLAVIYLISFDKKNRKRNFIYLMLIGVMCIINIYNSREVIKVAAMSYFSYLFKYLYYLIMLLFFMRWYKEYEIKLSDLRIPILIISLASVLSIITNTAYISYQNNPFKEGFSLWYSSANELGNILCLLFPVCIYNALHNKDGIKLDLYLVSILGATLLVLGTKVGLLGYFLIVLTYLILRIIFCKSMKLDMRFLIMLTLFVIPLLFFRYLPGAFNIDVSFKNVETNPLLSGREKSLERIKTEREKENLVVKIFGKSYYGDQKEKEQIMLVEQDFIDVFFMYGYAGIILVIGPLIFLFYKLFMNFVELYKRNKKISKKYLAVSFAIGLCLIVSFISGHTILTPSVSLYLVLLIALLSNINFNKNQIKKRVLVSDTKEIFNKDFIFEIVKDKSLPRSKLLCYLIVKNKKYDYIIDNKKDSKYMQTYLKYSNGLHIKEKDLK